MTSTRLTHRRIFGTCCCLAALGLADCTPTTTDDENSSADDDADSGKNDSDDADDEGDAGTDDDQADDGDVAGDDNAVDDDAGGTGASVDAGTGTDDGDAATADDVDAGDGHGDDSTDDDGTSDNDDSNDGGASDAVWSGVIQARQPALDFALDGDDNMFLLTDILKGRVDKLDASGNLVAVYDGPTPLPEPTWDPSTGLSVADIVATAEGNVYVLASTNLVFPGQVGNAGVRRDLLLIKLDSLAQAEWVRTIQNEEDLDSGTLQGAELALDSDGNLLVQGWGSFLPLRVDTDSDASPGAFLAKFDAEGELLWSNYYYGSSTATVTDDANSIYVLGQRQWLGHESDEPNTMRSVTKYDADGSQLWVANLGTLRPDYPLGQRVAPESGGFYDIAVSADGTSIYLVGGSNMPDLEPPWLEVDANAAQLNPPGAVLSKMDASDGTLLYQQVVRGQGVPSTCSDPENCFASIGADKVTVSADGEQVFVLGGVVGDGVLEGLIGAGGSDVMIIGFASDGTFEWANQLGGVPANDTAAAQQDFGKDITVDSRGNVVILGQTAGDFGNKMSTGTTADNWFIAKLRSDDGSLL